ncbi:hypothetical protein QE152_g9632 [Popillia japonica]|uniref:Ty3 transposon capsid-like protein domain-containing protein n=1 Tax=Popillia japonica TaxID=7064 RepID=A0AAW1LU95_POPJA
MNGTADQRLQIEWERRLIEQERELLRRERELLQHERRINEKNDKGHSVHYHQNAMQVIPEFNPGKPNSSNASQWIAAAENLANIFKWDNRTLLFNAITKLNGAAKMWFEGIQRKIYDWESFKQQLLLDFPDATDDADIHFELSKRRKRPDESFEHFIYDMKAIAAKGTLNDNTVLKYIIGGISDRDLAKSLAINSPYDTRDLLMKIKNYETTMRNIKQPATTSNLSTSTTFEKDADRKCFNCNEVDIFQENVQNHREKRVASNVIKYQQDAIIIRRSALDQPNIKITKESQYLKIEQTPEKHQKEEATTGDEPKGVSKSVNQAEVVKEIRNDTDDESLEWIPMKKKKMWRSTREEKK